MQYEVIIVGGGVAGCSAALVLGRCRRRLLVCDDGRPRNAVARGVHGYLTRDGVPPHEFLRLAREEVLQYPTVQWRNGRVKAAARVAGGFEVTLPDDTVATARKLLLATGLVDELPEIDGFHRFWGHSVFTCPFCDAWEVRDQRFVVLGREPGLAGFALELRQWAAELTICTDGAHPLDEAQRNLFQRLGIEVIDTPVAALEGTDQQLERLRFVDGQTLEARVLFVATSQRQHSPLARQLDCAVDEEGVVKVCTETCAAGDGVWIAGNASTGLQMAIIAAAEGLKAAHAINERLVEEDVAGA